MVSKCLVALGSNLSTSTRTPVELLGYALEVLEDESFYLRAMSRWYSTPAFPAGSGSDYVNGVAFFNTTLSPNAVLDHLAKTEEKLGRVRNARWGERVCDLDLLSSDDVVLPNIQTYNYWKDLPLERQMTDTPSQLILPHPRIQDRAFVLIPLKDVAPDWHHPVGGKGIDALIEALPKSDVEAVKPMEVSEN